MMNFILTAMAGLFLFGFPAWGRDKDTIPLGRQGAPGVSEESTVPYPQKATNSEEETGPQPLPSPYVASLETFGSSRINAVALKKFLGRELDTWLAKGVKSDPEAMELETKLADKVKQKWGFAQADWSVMEFFEPGDMPIHITLDVVEKEDVAKRMPFLPAPTGEFKDPAGLVAAWTEYEETAMDLVETGELEPEADDCVAFHCPFGHTHPKLKKYEKIFVEGVTKHAPELIAIQSNDKRPEFRAAASYLLAYLKDGKKVISLMLSRIRDNDPRVRNNVLRVLGDIAEFHPDLIIPVKPVLEALHFPKVSDRSKAVYVAYLTALSSQQARDQMLKKSVPDLLQLMQSTQPDQHELSQIILRKISGKNYAATDTQAWQNWYNRLPKLRTPSGD